MGRAKRRREKKKKRIIICIVILTVILAIGATVIYIKNKDENQEKIVYKFYATVIERTNDGIIVSPNKGELVNKKYPILNISLRNKIVDENIQKEDLVKVEYLKENLEEKTDRIVVEKIEEISYSKMCDLYLTVLENIIIKENEENISSENIGFIQIDEMILNSEKENLEEIIPIYLRKYNKNISFGNYNDYIKKMEDKELGKGYYIVIQKLEKIEEDKYRIDIKKYSEKNKFITKKYIVKYDQNKWKIQ